MGHQEHLPPDSWANADALAKRPSQEAHPDLLDLLSLQKHGFTYLSYSLKFYTISIFFFRARFGPNTILGAGKGRGPARRGMWLERLRPLTCELLWRPRPPGRRTETFTPVLAFSPKG